MKKIHFIRHAEGERNIDPSRTEMTSFLTSKGRKQADLVASRCAGILIDKIISSTMARSKETADIIAKKSLN